MSHPVIPAPVRFDPGPGRFAFRAGTPIACTAAEVAPAAERFGAEIVRRTGLRVAPQAGHPGPGEPPAVRIELGLGGEDAARPAPQGLSPAGGDPADERYSLAVETGQVVLRAAGPAGVARGLTTLVQLVAAGDRDDGAIWLPGARILDAPRYAWRGLSLDLARRFFTPGEVRRVIDLIALYKLNVLHLHLTDDQGWRLPVGGPDGGSSYSAADLRALVAYAADRFVTVVPEVDTPGHVSALMGSHPELITGRNAVEHVSPSGDRYHTGWLDPELPATFGVVRDVLAEVADIFPGPYLHIGGDEPWGMPHEEYASYVERLRGLVRSLGKHPLGWQESARAGLGPDDIVQYWLSGTAVAAWVSDEVRAKLDADLALGRRDVETAVQASVPVIVSPQRHCYLDVPYADPPADPAQADRHRRVGLRLYAPTTLASSFGWEPAEALGAGRAAQVAGVEAAVWAETITGFGDLAFLLLPRLPGLAHKAWSDPRAASWTEHRDRLAWHARLWAQDDLEYFRAATVSWR